MIVIRRYQEGIVLNPFEYVTDKEGNVLNFKDKDQALEFISQRLPDVENEEVLNEVYGVYLHEIDKAQYAQLNETIELNKTKGNDG